MQINKIRNKRGAITADLREIKRIRKEYYKPFYTSKIHNIDQNGQILSKTQTAKTDLRRNRKSEQTYI